MDVFLVGLGVACLVVCGALAGYGYGVATGMKMALRFIRENLVTKE